MSSKPNHHVGINWRQGSFRLHFVICLDMAEIPAPWYHGTLPAEAASKICAKVGRNGAFLVRKSQGVRDAYTLSIFFDGEVYHHRIRQTGDMLCMEATKKKFPSMNDLVTFYTFPREEFIHPLTVAIYPSLVKQLDANDENWREKMVVDSGLYDERPRSTCSRQQLPPTPIPYPALQPENNEDVVLAGKPNTEDDDLPPPPPPVTCQSDTDNRDDEGNSWPEPSPPVKPKVKPKPKSATMRLRQKPAIDPNCDSRRQHARPKSSHYPVSPEILDPQSYNYPDNSFDGAFKPGMPRRRSLSLDETVSLGRNRENSTSRDQGRLQRSKTTYVSRNDSKSDMPVHPKKTDKPRQRKSSHPSPFKTLAQLFNRKKKRQQSREDTSVNEDQSEQNVAEDFISIFCKTLFIATEDYSSQDNAMQFRKGSEMVVKGVRNDGWWHCYNKTTKETGWVYQEYLKPKSNEQWFEAKPVETESDQHAYEQMENNSDFDDDDDDSNYCRYLLPVDDANQCHQSEHETGTRIDLGHF